MARDGHDLDHQDYIFYVMAERHLWDGRAADTSDFNGESCAGDRARFPRRSNLTQVANGPPLLQRYIVCPSRFEAKMDPANLLHP